MGKSRRIYNALAVAALVLTGGCASQIMSGFVGKPLQSVMVKYGPPANAFDMGDGRRAFQWVMTSSYVMPTYANSYGSAYNVGNTTTWTQNTLITGGQPINSKCAYTMYGHWSDAANTWIIEGFEKPNLMCS